MLRLHSIMMIYKNPAAINICASHTDSYINSANHPVPTCSLNSCKKAGHVQYMDPAKPTTSRTQKSPPKLSKPPAQQPTTQ